MRPAGVTRTSASFAHLARGGLAAVMLVATGCAYGYATALPLGRGAPPRPPDCAVRYADLLPHEAQRLYEQVGFICYSYPGAPVALPPESTLIDETRPQVCRLGGEVVVRHGYCPAYGSLELGVYVTRSPGAGRVARADGGAAAVPAASAGPD
jgi:hypothetical protein